MANLFAKAHGSIFLFGIKPLPWKSDLPLNKDHIYLLHSLHLPQGVAFLSIILLTGLLGGCGAGEIMVREQAAQRAWGRYREAEQELILLATKSFDIILDTRMPPRPTISDNKKLPSNKITATHRYFMAALKQFFIQEETKLRKPNITALAAKSNFSQTEQTQATLNLRSLARLQAMWRALLPKAYEYDRRAMTYNYVRGGRPGRWWALLLSNSSSVAGYLHLNRD